MDKAGVINEQFGFDESFYDLDDKDQKDVDKYDSKRESDRKEK